MLLHSATLDRLGNGPHNLAVLRHMALNVAQKDPTKGSLHGRLTSAGWDDADLSRLLALVLRAIALPSHYPLPRNGSGKRPRQGVRTGGCIACRSAGRARA